MFDAPAWFLEHAEEMWESGDKVFIPLENVKDCCFVLGEMWGFGFS